MGNDSEKEKSEPDVRSQKPMSEVRSRCIINSSKRESKQEHEKRTSQETTTPSLHHYSSHKVNVKIRKSTCFTLCAVCTAAVSDSNITPSNCSEFIIQTSTSQTQKSKRLTKMYECPRRKRLFLRFPPSVLQRGSASGSTVFSVYSSERLEQSPCEPGEDSELPTSRESEDQPTTWTWRSLE